MTYNFYNLWDTNKILNFDKNDKSLNDSKYSNVDSIK